MSNYESIDCGDIDGKRCSEQLPGALAANQSFFYDKCTDDYYQIHESVQKFVPDDIKLDRLHNIFVDENGAVADAYSFEGLSEEEKKGVIATIIVYRQEKFPGYEFVMLPGRFPIRVEGAKDLYDSDEGIMSTHILYIKNYKDILEKTEETGKKLR